jgi:acyl-CoA ligase (AMP-forming) (exosortase A-associated)
MIYLLHHLLDAGAERFGSSCAIRYRKQDASYALLHDRSQRLAAGLRRLGVSKGDRVAVHLANRTEVVETMFACSRIGAIFVPVNPALRARQIEHVLTDCGASVLITSSASWQTLALNVPSVRTVLTVDAPAAAASTQSTVVAYEEACATAPAIAGRSVIDRDVAALFYTSGSTGRQKGVVLTHRNLVSGAESVSEYLRNDSGDRLLAALPWSFDYGLNQVTTAILKGGCAVLTNYSLPGALLSEIYDEGITGLAGVPTMWMQLAAAKWPDRSPAKLRYVTNSGGALPRALIQKLARMLPDTKIYCMYGLTEAFRSTYLPPEDLERKMGSIGKAVPNQEVVVVRPDGTPCAPGEAGELVHRGSFVSLGYWNDQELTARRFRPFPTQTPGAPSTEIAVWSGDLVRADEEGYLYFVSRIDQQIKTSGVRVSPSEVEEVVAEVADVVECVAVGVPDEVLGQRVVLNVVTSGDQDIVGKEIREHCRQHLPAYISISSLVFRDSLPRTPTGKPDRMSIAQSCL